MRTNLASIGAVMAVVFALLIFVIPPAFAQSDSTAPVSWIEMPTAAHFMTPGGERIVVEPGDYEVELVGQALRLSALDGRPAVLIAVDELSHDEIVDEPTASAYAGETDEDRDILEITLFLPGDKYYSAVGSISGVSTRGWKKRKENRQAMRQENKENRKKNREIRKENRKEKGLVDSATDNYVNRKKVFLENKQNREDTRAENSEERELLDCIKDKISNQGNGSDINFNLLSDPATAYFNIELRVDIGSKLNDIFDVIDDSAVGSPTPASLVDASFIMMEKIGKERPALNCVYRRLKPHQATIRNKIKRRTAFIETKFTAIKETLMENIRPQIVGKIKKVIVKKAFEDSRENMAAGVYARHMVEQQHDATLIIVAELAKPNPNPDIIKSAVSGAANWPPDIHKEFIFDMISFRVSEEIDNEDRGIGKLIKSAGDKLDLTHAMSAKVSSAVCGLVPEAGAAVCALIQTPLYLIWNKIIKVKLMDAIKKTVHDQAQRAIDAIQDNSDCEDLLKLEKPMHIAYAICTDSTLKGDIEDTAMDDLPEGFQQSIGDYNDALKAVIEQWKKDK